MPALVAHAVHVRSCCWLQCLAWRSICSHDWVLMYCSGTIGVNGTMTCRNSQRGAIGLCHHHGGPECLSRGLRKIRGKEDPTNSSHRCDPFSRGAPRQVRAIHTPRFPLPIGSVEGCSSHVDLVHMAPGVAALRPATPPIAGNPSPSEVRRIASRRNHLITPAHALLERGEEGV
jgi:hypothetical protein